MARLAAILVAALIALPASAIDTGQAFDDPAQQQRYERLIRELRCLVCQNQSIADSNATLASDLRREVRDMIESGRGDDEIRAFMTERYGDFVLYEPPMAPRTWLLWLAPALLLLGGIGVTGMVVLRRARAAKANPAALDEEPDEP
ncbi:MAG TPA: cytochrome c-type biogenesis protein [Steroidobacteraceae bacterium]|nr:cytochrome c-type biogenesis protein [Steroidobacteraceae bacterium]